MPTVVLTGFPGFLASAFLPNLLSRLDAATSVTCVVQSRYRPLAERRQAEIAVTNPAWKDRIRLVEGDITQSGLGLANLEGPLRSETREVYHFAALYDLTLPRPLGMKINVEGTVNVLNFIAGCSSFGRLHYISTCYVSGRHPGNFTENDLIVGQRFNNYYEETKYLAEVEVQNRMKQGMAATVYRPAIVVGDSQTGATQKYDGPYAALRWLLRCPRIALMVTVGDTKSFHVNLVPRDFVVSAISRLSALDVSGGRVYQLCDPHPSTVDELYGIFGAVTGRRVVRFPLPPAVARGAFKYLPGVQRITGITPESLDYFTHPTDYTCEDTLRDLAGTGILCPSFRDYAATLVRFIREHPEIGTEAMH
ncbi:MAG TPA: SDR family oxidoreductase [Planctomycetaceae bacterium]|nr:SDR family oxidoreductase [Planctomycetaceae bacterium]